jgi:hypothetical protein
MKDGVDGGAIEIADGPACVRPHRGDKLMNVGFRQHAEAVQKSIAEHCRRMRSRYSSVFR